MKGRDFITMQEFTPKEIWRLLKLSRAFKRSHGRKAGEPLRKKSVVLLFQKPSTRTSVE